MSRSWLATPAPALVVACLVSNAAAGGLKALPLDTLAVVEVTKPTQRLDTITGTLTWEGLVSVMEIAAASAPQGEDRRVVAELAALAAKWPLDEGFRDRARAVMANRLMVVVLPQAPDHGVGVVVALEGNGTDTASAALARLAPELGADLVPAARGWFALVRRHHVPWAVGRTAGRWVVLGPATASISVERVARCLDGESVAPLLVARPEVREAMARIPRGTHVRVVARPAALTAEFVTARPDDQRLRALRVLGAGVDVIVIGRNLESDRVEGWAAVGLDAASAGPLVGLIGSLEPLGSWRRVSPPADTLASWRVGVVPRTVVVTADAIFRELAPGISGRLERLRDELFAATGVDLGRDVIDRLRPGIEGVLLSPDPNDPWLRLRPMVLAAIGDGRSGRPELETTVRWLAGSVADGSEGMASATVIREESGGFLINGLAIDAVIDLPLPSPTVAASDDVMVLSPSPSAVREMVAAGAFSHRWKVRYPSQGFCEWLEADAGGVVRALAGVIRSGSRLLPRVAERAEDLAVALQRLADGLGEVHAEATVERGPGRIWWTAHAELRLR